MLPSTVHQLGLAQMFLLELARGFVSLVGWLGFVCLFDSRGGGNFLGWASCCENITEGPTRAAGSLSSVLCVEGRALGVSLSEGSPAQLEAEEQAHPLLSPFASC